jgi:uncharacterized membrane protein YkoI
MKSRNIFAIPFAALLMVAGCETNHHNSQAELLKEAKVSEADARQQALAKVPTGIIKEGELERENGHLQWSFDVATPDSKDITEVNIDAVSGQVLDVSKEKPEKN